MSEPEQQPREPQIPPPPSEKSKATLRFICAALGLAVFAGVWLLTANLPTGWRLLFAVLVSAPLVLVPDLLRDSSKPPPGFKPRKWQDEDD